MSEGTVDVVSADLWRVGGAGGRVKWGSDIVV